MYSLGASHDTAGTMLNSLTDKNCAAGKGICYNATGIDSLPSSLMTLSARVARQAHNSPASTQFREPSTRARGRKAEPHQEVGCSAMVYSPARPAWKNRDILRWRKRWRSSGDCLLTSRVGLSNSTGGEVTQPHGFSIPIAVVVIKASPRLGNAPDATGVRECSVDDCPVVAIVKVTLIISIGR
jgi:hypothetical protein